MTFPDTSIEEVGAAEAAALLAGGGWRLIDCREADEIDIVSIGSAENMPLTVFNEFWPVAFGDSDTRPILTICHHGMRSLNLARFLRSRGVSRVWSVKGGVDLWAREVDPSLPRY